MSGATSAVPSAGAIHARQRTAPRRTASSACASPRSQAARSRKPIETRAWLANSRTAASPRSSRSGATARPSRSQPRVTAAVRRLRGSSSASIPRRWATRSSCRSAAWTSGSRLSPEAVARCSISTTARIAALRSAGSGSRRWGAMRASASRPASRPRASSAGARSISSSRRERSAGAARGSPISPRACSAGYCSQGSPRSASMSRGTARGEPICPRLVAAAWRTLTSGSESASTRRGDRGRLLHRAEHHRGEEPDLLVGVGEESQERRRRGGPEPHVDLHRRVARARVVAVAQRRLEGGQERLGGEAGQGLDRGLPHRPAPVPHRHEQRGDRLRAPRGAELRDRPAPRGLLPAAQGVEVRLTSRLT